MRRAIVLSTLVAIATLSISVHIWKSDAAQAGAARVDLLSGYRELGVSRVIALIEASTTRDDALESFRDDANAAGAELAEPQFA